MTEYDWPSLNPLNTIGCPAVGLLLLVSVATMLVPSLAVQLYPMIADFPVSTGSPIKVIDTFDGAATPAMDGGLVGTGGSAGVTDAEALSAPKLVGAYVFEHWHVNACV